MDYSQLYTWQLSPLSIGLLVIAAIAAIALLSTLLPTLNLIIKKSRQNEYGISEPEDGISVIVSTGFHTDRLRTFVENIYAQIFSKHIEIII
ncbi:MAG: hypothetical protein K2H84_05525, partial [Paramuribaculum sp.]|nr:hypothetical protein [Paramuribaculum sp.]